MDREIKFRVWDGEQMISPDYVNRQGYGCWKSNSIPETSNRIMQYTGLKDKVGKEIYEGDIVKKIGYPQTTFAVTFNNGRFNVSIYHMVVIKVIGNIFENAELLTPSV